MPVYEVVWSVFENSYIARPMSALSSLESKCIGTYNDCIDWIRRNK